MQSYTKFFLMLLVHYVIMLGLTYVLVDTTDHIYLNINRAYMAGIMVAPMAISMLLFMRGMYPRPLVNTAIYAGGVTAIVVLFVLMRAQVPVGDVQFLRSMIPHHSSAIVMCEEGNIRDTEIRELCEDIVATQEREIEQMQDILDRLAQ